ncbi:MAG: ACP S-malonyltransferase [Deferribacteraceae bacterium]|jgi:[acyl-carrier-protein] S-malonyltransferase|nr:ACP S-malonyltransferase [Deferribacteraceae bacterium]
MSTAVIFPGQGSQIVGMGADLLTTPATALFEQADLVLGYPLTKIMFEGPEETLRLTQNAQPALLTHSIALWTLIKHNINPSYFAGHSLGEYTALVAANGLTFEDAVKTVHNRGKFMQETVPVGIGGMAAVIGAADADVEMVCKEISSPENVVEPANYNSNGQIVIAGHTAALEKFSVEIKQRGAKRVVPLPVSAPFHCSLMKPAQALIEKYLDGIKILPLTVPVVNNVDACVECKPAEVKDALVRQISGAVRWTQTIKLLVSLGVTTFIEIGAGAVLSGLIKKIDINISCVNISVFNDIKKVNG